MSTLKKRFIDSADNYSSLLSKLMMSILVAILITIEQVIFAGSVCLGISSSLIF